MKNLKKIVTLAALALTLTLSLTSAKEANAATTVTKKQVAKAIAAAQEKAINKRKVVKVTVTFETKKKVWKYVDDVTDLVSQIYWGKLYGTWSSGTPFDLELAAYDEDYEGKWIGDYNKTIYGKWTKDGDEYTVIFKFMGNHKKYKDTAETRECAEKIYDAIVTSTEGMTQAQKTCYVIDWIYNRMDYNWDSLASDTSAIALWNGTAYGVCQHFASVAQRYLLMAGVKHVAYVRIPKANHAIVAVRLEDNKIYTIDPISGYKGVAESDEEAMEFLQAYTKLSSQPGRKHKLTWEDGKKETFKAVTGYIQESKYSW